MTKKSMTAAERDALKTMDRDIPSYGGDTQPFNVSQRPAKYRLEDLSKEESASDRTDWLAKNIFVIWQETGKPVPYAFRTKDGTIRSLDAGCLGHLIKRDPPAIEIAERDDDGYIVAVRPSITLSEQCNRIGLDILRKRLGLPEAGIGLDFDISAPVDERRKAESEQTVREGARAFREALLRIWGRKCAITGTATATVLDGAHIYRYLGPKTNHPTNGMLLRADVHRLFDKHLLSLRYEGERLAVVCSVRIASSDYASYRFVCLPESREFHPDRRLIEHRYSEFLAKEDERQQALANKPGYQHG